MTISRKPTAILHFVKRTIASDCSSFKKLQVLDEGRGCMAKSDISFFSRLDMLQIFDSGNGVFEHPFLRSFRGTRSDWNEVFVLA